MPDINGEEGKGEITLGNYKELQNEEVRMPKRKYTPKRCKPLLSALKHVRVCGVHGSVLAAGGLGNCFGRFTEHKTIPCRRSLRSGLVLGSWLGRHCPDITRRMSTCRGDGRILTSQNALHNEKRTVRRICSDF